MIAFRSSVTYDFGSANLECGGAVRGQRDAEGNSEGTAFFISCGAQNGGWI